MRSDSISAYYFCLLCWILVTLVTSENEECIVHQNGEEFSSTIVTIPPVSSRYPVQLLIKENDEDEGMTLNFAHSTDEWYYLDWSHKGISKSYNPERTKKIFKAVTGQASGNCETGKFTWKITDENKKAELFNTKQKQDFKIKLQKATDVYFYDNEANYYLCRNPKLDNTLAIRKDKKCLDQPDPQELLSTSKEYTLLVKPRDNNEIPNITVSSQNSFSIKEGRDLTYIINFEPSPAVSEDESEDGDGSIGYIVEDADSQWSIYPTTLSPGSTTDVNCNTEKSQKSKSPCIDAPDTGSNVTSIVLGVLVAILFVALLLTCCYFKNRQMGDKLHPMPESHTNGTIGDSEKAHNDYSAMDEMKEKNSETNKTQFNRISQMPTTLEEDNDIYDSAVNTKFNRISKMPTALEEDNDIYDSAENVLDRKV